MVAVRSAGWMGWPGAAVNLLACLPCALMPDGGGARAPSDAPTVADSPPASAGPGALYYVAANEPGASDANNGLHPTHQGGGVRPQASWRRRGSLVATPELAPKEERNA